MLKNELKKLIISNIISGEKTEVENAIKTAFFNLFDICYNNLSNNEKIALINEFCEVNHYEQYLKATNENICLLLQNDALAVADFIKNHSRYELENGYIYINGYGKIELISKYDLKNMYSSDDYFIQWLKDNDKMDDFCDLVEDKEEIINEVKEEIKKTFVKVRFYLYSKDYEYLLKLKKGEKEPEYLNGYIHKITYWDNTEAYENIVIFNGKKYHVADRYIKKIEGFDSIINHRLKCPPVSFMQAENCKYIKGVELENHPRKSEIKLNIGSYDYLSEHFSGGGCDGELQSYYLSILKDYTQIVFLDNGKIYEQLNEHLQEYNPLNASQSDKTREKIASFINWLWGEVKRYNEQCKEK